MALRRQSLLAIFQFPFRHAQDRFDVWRRPVCGAHERGRALARPVTVRFCRRGPIDDRRNDAGRLERSQQADAPFALSFTPGSPIVSAVLAFLGAIGQEQRCKRSARHSPSDILGALAEIEEGRRARRGPGQPARQALFRQPSALRAVHPPTRHITPDAWVISFTPPARDPVER